MNKDDLRVRVIQQVAVLEPAFSSHQLEKIALCALKAINLPPEEIKRQLNTTLDGHCRIAYSIALKCMNELL